MASDLYTIVFGNQGSGGFIQQARSQDANGFTIRNYQSDTVELIDANVIGFAVFDDVPITVSGGGGGGTTVNYNGASAWGNVDADGSLRNGQNCATSRISEGTYSISFPTPLSTADYAITGSASNNNFLVRVGTQTINGFEVFIVGADTAPEVNADFSFAVFSENAIAPQSGVGADAWALTAGDAVLQGGYNLTVQQGSSNGSYEYTFITPMPNADYGILVSGNPTNDGTKTDGYTYDKTATGFTVKTIDVGNGGGVQPARHAVAVFASSTVTPTYTWTRDGTTLKPANDGDGVQVGASYDNVFLTSGKGDGTSPSQLVINGRPASGSNNAFRIDSFPSNGTTQTTVAKVNYDGTADFVGGAFKIASNGTIESERGFDFHRNSIKVGVMAYDPSSNGKIVCVSKGSDGTATNGVELRKDATSWSSYSQRSLKTNFQPITDGLTKVSSLSAVTGRYKTDEERTSRSFLIADEVQQVLPEAVSGSGTEEDPLSLRYTEIIPLLVSALRDAKDRIEALEAKVTQLEGGNN
jgi:hypothetical protein